MVVSRNEQISNLRFCSEEKKSDTVNILFHSYIDTFDYSGITQLILSEYNKYINITNQVFKTSLLSLCCKNNYYILLKRIINLDPEHKIDIHYDDEELWKQVVMANNVECAKVLISLEKEYGRIDIHTNGDFTVWNYFMCFKKYERRQIEMCKFLLSLEETHGSYDWMGDDYSLLMTIIASGIYTYHKNPDYQINETLLTDIINANVHNDDDIDHEDVAHKYKYISYMVCGLVETNINLACIVFDRISKFQNPEVKHILWFYIINACLEANVTQSKIWTRAFQHGLTPCILKNTIHRNNNITFRRCKNKRIITQLVRYYLDYEYDWSYVEDYKKYDTEMYEFATAFIAIKKIFTREMQHDDMFDSNIFGIIESYMIPDLDITC